MTKILKCPECEANGHNSIVRTVDHGCATTAMLWERDAYWDEVGDYHFHDQGNDGTDYRCSNDHQFHIAPKCVAPGCDWYAERDAKRAAYRRSRGIE